jgi:tRNA nucleotidyltransferase/poly(A) polymerase
MPNIERQDEFIRSLGVEAYRVGGSVRDEILGRKPKDADYIVRGVGLADLQHDLVEAMRFGKITSLVDRRGQQFGWRVSERGLGMMEIALPRRESDAGSGRAQVIEVDPNLPLAVDAERRDFTFNALYRNVNRTWEMGYPWKDIIEDPTGHGLHDLQHRIIRTTHHDSFRDDPLRILRALRFVSTLDADLAIDTHWEMLLWAPEVDGLTAHGYTSGTVYDEFSKLLMGAHPDKALRIARDTGVLAVAMPELAAMLGFEQGSRYHDMTTDEHTFVALHTAAQVEAPLRVRWALLFHDAGKPEAAWEDEKGYTHYYRPDANYWDTWRAPAPLPEDHEVVGERLWRTAAKRMNVDRRMTADVAALIREHMVPVGKRVPSTWIARKRIELGDELLRDLLMMRACDLSGKGQKVSLTHLASVGRMVNIHEAAISANVPASVKDLEINGRDAHAAGLEGRAIGDALKRVLDEVAIDPSHKKLSREWQLSRLEGAS